VAAGGRGRQEVRRIGVQVPAHRGQRHGTGAQRFGQAVDRHPDEPVPRPQGRGLLRDARPERTGQHRHHDIGRGQRHPPVGGEAVMRDPAVPRSRIGAGHPKGRDRPPAKHRGGVDRLASRHPREPPRGAGAQVARPLRDHRHVRADDVPRGEQPGVHGHRLQVTAERLAGGDRRGQPARLPQPGRRPGEPRGQRAAVEHDVGDTGGTRLRSVCGKKASQHGRESRVQVRHHHRHSGHGIR
jgi:hypothetical protein